MNTQPASNDSPDPITIAALGRLAMNDTAGDLASAVHVARTVTSELKAGRLRFVRRNQSVGTLVREARLISEPIDVRSLSNWAENHEAGRQLCARFPTIAGQFYRVAELRA